MYYREQVRVSVAKRSMHREPAALSIIEAWRVAGKVIARQRCSNNNLQDRTVTVCWRAYA